MKRDVVLKNGLKFISHGNNGIQKVSIGLYFKAGTVYETLKNNGITHLTEHMFFRCLNNITQKELYYRMESIGTTMMAKTYKNYVCFFMSLLPQFLDEAAEILSQILMNFNWKEDDIEKEKRVVMKQIELKYSSFDEYIESIYFKDTKYEIPIMGTLENVKKITVQELNNWKKAFFNCDNACLVLTGNYSEKDYNKIFALFENIHNKGVSSQHPKIIPNGYLKRTELSDRIIAINNNISDIYITFDLIPNEEIFFAARFLSSILGDGLGSKLSLELRENSALTDDVFSTVNVYYSFAKLNIEFSVLNKDVETSLRLLFNQINLIKYFIDLKDYESNIMFLTKNKRTLIDETEKLNDYYGWINFILENENNSIENIIDKYSQITIQDLKQNANKIFLKNNMIIYIKNNNKLLKEKKLEALLLELRKNL